MPLNMHANTCRIVALLFITITAGCAHPPTAELGEGARLNQIIDQYYESYKRIDAFSAPYFNVEEDLGKFGDYSSPAFFQRSKALLQSATEKLGHINQARLSDKDRRTYLLFKEDTSVALRGFDFQDRYLSLNQMGNRLHDFIDSSNQALTIFPFDSVKHYEDFAKRAEGFPAYVENQIALLKEGVQNGVVLSCIVAKKVPHTYQEALDEKATENPFYRPITFMPKEIPEADQKRLASTYSKMVSEIILPGYQKFDRYFRKEYLPHCRKGFGLADFPNAKEWYQFAILENTNLEIKPEVLHQTGLEEVKRISQELEKVKTQLGFKGSLKAFMTKTANDPKSFFTKPEDLMAAFQKVKEATAKKIPQYFSLIPKSDFKIVNSSNPDDPAGSYNGPTETAPFGRFLVNPANLRSVPVFDVTTLLLHETVPGHHFQLALAYEMTDQLSEYQRKIYGSNSFVEGWALYSEFLGNEMGMFEDPFQRFGNLNDEMLRAVRLVVDTGIHAYGWSQKKAIAYMTDHLASDPKDIEVEINRYSVWPGQALGYKVGQLKILELRRKAEKLLGAKFDIKEFHKAVIGNGTVSLGVLEAQVNSWMNQVASNTQP
jgi:uncharacterized protein (DUF885 family)